MFGSARAFVSAVLWAGQGRLPTLPPLSSSCWQQPRCCAVARSVGACPIEFLDLTRVCVCAVLVCNCRICTPNGLLPNLFPHTLVFATKPQRPPHGQGLQHVHCASVGSSRNTSRPPRSRGLVLPVGPVAVALSVLHTARQCSTTRATQAPIARTCTPFAHLARQRRCLFGALGCHGFLTPILLCIWATSRVLV